MNLTTDRWIPIVWQTGLAEKVSLLDVFQRGEDIRDLAVRPHERIALMRLLICIAQAALDGPKDRADWKTCRSRLAKVATDYLAKWKHAFELFGEGQRFLQVKAEGAGEAELDKLDFVDAKMSTLFNQEVHPGRIFSENWIVFRMLTYQAFSAGGTCGGSYVDEHGRTKPQKGKNGPCRDGSALHCYIRGGDLAESVYRNLVTIEDVATFLKPLEWGRPVWEFPESTLSELEKRVDVPRTYLGRLVPLSRSLWLQSDRTSALVANGLEYPSISSDDFRGEPAVAVVSYRDRQGKQSRRAVAARATESANHPWRELHSVLMMQRDGLGGALCVRNVDESAVFDIWLGAFVTDQAKVDDSVEFVFARLPSKMFLDSNIQELYAQGVTIASKEESTLRHAVQCYRIALERSVGTKEDAERSLGRLRRSDKDRLNSIVTHMLSAFWTRLESEQRVLVECSTQLDLLPWRTRVAAAARAAYDLACPHETARQLKAYSVGLKALFETGKAPNSMETKEEVEE